MVWGKKSNRQGHRERSRAFSAQLSRLELPAHREAGVIGGSRGGAPVWVLHAEGFGLMPSPCSCGTAGDGPANTSSDECPRHGPRRRLKKLMDKGAREGGRWLPHKPDREGRGGGWGDAPYRTALAGGHDKGFTNGADGADPDGYAVFGRYPKRFLGHVLKIRLLGDVRRDEILHICSGTLTERWTVDVRAQARPRVQADGAALPFRDASFKAVMMDPPYSDAYARNLYGVENPRPSWLLREAARVVVPGGRVGILHVALPFAPPDCRLVRVYPVSTGVGFRIRALTIYQRAGDPRQGEL